MSGCVKWLPSQLSLSCFKWMNCDGGWNFPVDSMFTIGINFGKRTEGKEGEGSDDVVRKRGRDRNRETGKIPFQTLCLREGKKHETRPDPQVMFPSFPSFFVCISQPTNPTSPLPSLPFLPSLAVCFSLLSFYMDCPSIRFQNSCLKQIISVSEYSCFLFPCLCICVCSCALFPSFTVSLTSHSLLPPIAPSPSHSPHVFDKTLFNRIWQDEEEKNERRMSKGGGGGWEGKVEGWRRYFSGEEWVRESSAKKAKTWRWKGGRKGQRESLKLLVDVADVPLNLMRNDVLQRSFWYGR